MVLEAFSLDRILTPEQDAARMLAQLLELNADVEPFQIDDEYYVFKFNLPLKLVGYKINELDIEKEFGLKVISLIKGKRVLNSAGISILEREVAIFSRKIMSCRKTTGCMLWLVCSVY